MGELVVLHGDLHHENVLRSGDGWLAIDPKGVVGEALQLDRARIGAWAWVQAELAAVWAVEDGDDPAYWLACAELLA